MRTLAFVVFGVCACSPSGVTASRVESAMAQTFANLIQAEESSLGLPPLDVASFRASASCRRNGPGSETRGGGDWSCTVEWFPPGHRGPWQETYELSVTADGCYTATADGEGGPLGGPKLTLRDGTVITNLLYAFDGCFDAM
jgi:hypothetical protein